MLPAAIRDLIKPPPGFDIDFGRPRNAPALVPFNGISWKVFSNPVALFVGGIAAVLLELAEPSVRSGVWDHSNFRADPVTRLRRTGFAALVTVYAPRAEAERMIGAVVKMHERVTGTTPDGLPYRANDPRLLEWVHATALFGFLEAYHCYVSPLSLEEKSLAFMEGQEAARLYGAEHPPRSWPEWERLLARTAPSLEASAVLGEFLDLMEAAPILPAWLRPLQRLLVRAAVELTPYPVRAYPDLQRRGLRQGEATLVRFIGKSVSALRLSSLPPAQATHRMSE